MPTYQYACKECDHQFEAVQSFSDSSLTDCPQCEGSLRKLFGSIGVIFKGSGFYRNDARASAGKAKSGASASSDSGKSSDSGSTASSTSASSAGSTSNGSAGSSTNGSTSGSTSTKTPSTAGSKAS